MRLPRGRLHIVAALALALGVALSAAPGRAGGVRPTAFEPIVSAYRLHESLPPGGGAPQAEATGPRVEAPAPPAYSWADQPGVIAHATGRVRKLALTNSREAFEENYRRGVRVFEVDFLHTRDGVLVARHDWSSRRYRRFGQAVPPGGVPTYARFARTLIRGKYHALTAGDLVALMKRHPDAWVVTDVKELSLRSRTDGLRQISRAIGSDSSVRGRVIVQIYGESDYPVARDLGFTNIVYTFYHLETTMSRALDFSAARHIRVVTVPSFMVSRSLVGRVRAHGLVLAAHTVNNPREAAWLWRAGVRMLYTDTLTPPRSRKVDVRAAAADLIQLPE